MVTKLKFPTCVIVLRLCAQTSGEHLSLYRHGRIKRYHTDRRYTWTEVAINDETRNGCGCTTGTTGHVTHVHHQLYESNVGNGQRNN